MGSNMKSAASRHAFRAPEHFDARGYLDRPFASEPLYVPVGLSLEGSRLVVPGEGDGALVREVMPQVGLLKGFLKLMRASDERILAYARCYGVLGVWETTNRLDDGGADLFDAASPTDPWDEEHCLFPLPEAANLIVMGYYPLGWVDGQYMEHAEIWRHQARQAAALLAISHHLHRGTLGRDEDWLTVFEWQLLVGLPWEGLDVAGQWALVAEVADAWLRLGDARPRIRLPGAGEGMVFSGRNLFGTLALQLASAISRREGLDICLGCGLPYTPTRVPPKGRRHYCSACRDRKVPQKHAARAYWDRRRQACQLFEGGVTTVEIARTLGKTEEQIRRWVGVEGD